LGEQSPPTTISLQGFAGKSLQGSVYIFIGGGAKQKAYFLLCDTAAERQHNE
jgi:hypothetical protein